MAKVVAETLLNICENQLFKTIIDRTMFLSDEFMDRCLSFWNYDLYTRKPSIAYNLDGEQYTTLDLSTLIFALVQRNAVIYVPEYDKQQPGRIKSGQIVVDDNRRGECLSVLSNKQLFNFSVRIKDLSVSQLRKNNEIEEGDYRSYLLTDMYGKLYDGWKNVVFVPTAKENEFLQNNTLWPESNIRFENFVTPEKWISFYGQYYFLTKALIERLVDERTYLKVLLQDMLDSGVRYPPSNGESNFDGWGETVEREEGNKVKVESFQAEVDFPEFENIYPKVTFSSLNLKYVSKKIKRINKYLEKYRFLTRSIELAFSNKIKYAKTIADFPYPSWIKNFGWEQDFRFPKQRTKWYRLKLNQIKVGTYSIALRFRWATTTQLVK